MAAVALVAGFVDAIAGGGGLLTVPALFAYGLAPHAAFGTNKAQSVAGSFTALVRYWRAGRVDVALARRAFPLGLLGAVLGAFMQTQVSPAVLRPVALVLLIGAAVSTLVLGSRMASLRPSQPLATSTRRALSLAFVIGAYDGFFGPGTGTFLIVGLVWLTGRDFLSASADAKVVNFASNLGALGWFAAQGTVVWSLALAMAAGQMVGAFLGAKTALKGQEKLVRAFVVGAALLLALKVGYDTFSA